MSAAIQKIEVQEPQVPARITPTALLADIIKGGAALDIVREMKAMIEWQEGREARKEYDQAIAAAKAEIPPIIKNREVDFTSQKGRTHYRYEDLSEIARTVDPILARHGLSYRYRVTSAVNEPVTVTCIISHRLGYSEETTLTAGRDETGNKNSIQAIGSTITFLQRYTLKAALGLSVTNDDDGRAGGSGAAISEEQIDAIRALIVEVAADIPRFCKYMKVERIEDIPASRYADAVKALEAKRSAS